MSDTSFAPVEGATDSAGHARRAREWAQSIGEPCPPMPGTAPAPSAEERYRERAREFVSVDLDMILCRPIGHPQDKQRIVDSLAGHFGAVSAEARAEADAEIARLTRERDQAQARAAHYVKAMDTAIIAREEALLRARNAEDCLRRAYLSQGNPYV